MVETILRRLIDHPQRRWLVITITSLVLLVATWPAVDDYRVSKSRRAELTAMLDSTRTSIEGLSRLETKLREQLILVGQYERRVMTAEQAQLFRDELMQLISRCGCYMRNMKLAPDTREREWYQEDHVLNTVKPVAGKARKTPFVLRTRQLSLSVEGTNAQVAQLLVELSKKQHLMHATRFRMERSSNAEDKIGLELEMTLFELASAVAKPAAA